MLSNIGASEIILVMVVALILFGPNKLPEIGRAAGKTIKEFKAATKGITDLVDVRDLTGSPKPRPVPQSRNVTQAANAEKAIEVKPTDTAIGEAGADGNKHTVVNAESVGMSENNEAEEVETRV